MTSFRIPVECPYAVYEDIRAGFRILLFLYRPNGGDCLIPQKNDRKGPRKGAFSLFRVSVEYVRHRLGSRTRRAKRPRALPAQAGRKLEKPQGSCSFRLKYGIKRRLHVEKVENQQPHNIAILGPKGTTYSFLAAGIAGRMLGWPKFDWDTGFVDLNSNSDILAKLLDGTATYGIIAAETEVRGRVDESLMTFSRLVEKYHNGDCPIRIICAIRMRLSFALFVKKGVKLKDIKTIRAHHQAIAACSQKIERWGWQVEVDTSNGIALQNVSNGSDHEAALGPVAALKLFHNLGVLNEAFEDAPAVTTFFVLGPDIRPLGKLNRALAIFQLKDDPMAISGTSATFGLAGLNLRYLQSFAGGVQHNRHVYNFVAEIDCPDDGLKGFDAALPLFKFITLRNIVLGPFPVLDADT